MHIFLACCHDNAYVRTLHNYVRHPAALEKVTLVKASRVGGEFSGLPFKTTTMHQVFWNAPVPYGAGLASATANTRSNERDGQGNGPRFF